MFQRPNEMTAGDGLSVADTSPLQNDGEEIEMVNNLARWCLVMVISLRILAKASCVLVVYDIQFLSLELREHCTTCLYGVET